MFTFSKIPMNDRNLSRNEFHAKARGSELSRYLEVLLPNRWRIGGIAAAVLFLGVGYAFLASPTYEADILLQVDDNESNTGLLGDGSLLLNAKTPPSAESEILQSRNVIAPVVERRHTYITALPHYFPLIGERIAKSSDGLSNPGLLGFGGYAWGSESIDVPVFDVPQTLEDEKFRLTYLGSGRYEITKSDLDKPIIGMVGQTLSLTQSTGHFKILVNSISANAGTTFNLYRSPVLEAIEILQKNFVITEKGKDSGIFSAALQGDDPDVVAATLNEIGDLYVTQSIERRARQAAKSRASLEAELPTLRSGLEVAEARLKSLKTKNETFDLSEEVTSYLQQISDAEASLMLLRQKRADLRAHFSPAHPAVKGIEEQIVIQKNRISDVDARVKALPRKEQETMRAEREVQVANSLYVGLINNIQQLKLVELDKVGRVRKLDFARVPWEPAKPKKLLVIALSAILGMMSGLIYAFLREEFFGGVTSAQEIEQQTNLSVVASVPFSKLQNKITKAIDAREAGAHVLALRQPYESSIESLRALRATLRRSVSGAANNRVLLTGPTPNVGKSFILANLAAVMSAGGQRVLVIDADVHRGCLDQCFGTSKAPGLTEVLRGEAEIQDVVHREVTPNLDFVSAGGQSDYASDLLLSPALRESIEKVSDRYDLVLIDTAPVLAVSDAAVVAPLCASTFLVVRFKKSGVGEITESLKRLSHTHSPIRGLILNCVSLAKANYRLKYANYRYKDYAYGVPQRRRIR
ncbi:exopolysaccharide transport protein family [Burkholderia sp. H160]|nr:exopolysaccharide transport protein family [Burkholderia sp. H160]